MSLESKIDELIAALDRNTAALTGAKPDTSPAPTLAKAKVGRPPKSEADKVAEAKARGAATEAEAEKVDDSKLPGKTMQEVETEAASKAEAGAALQNLIAGGKRSEAVAMLKKYGASSLSGLKPEDYAAFIAEAEEVLLTA